MTKGDKSNRQQVLLHAAKLVCLGIAASIIAGKISRSMKRRSLYGKVVLITGGSRGLGLALAHELARKGARLALCARTGSQLEKASEELKSMDCEVFTVQADLTDQNQVSEMVQQIILHYRGIDMLINNAGVMMIGPDNVMDVSDYKNVMDSNLWSSLYTIKSVIPHFRRRGQGHIVNICSIGGKVAVPHMVPYSVSKFALVGLSQGLAAELDRENIKVTTVIPNLMRTGSPRNVTIKGDHESEYAWFKLADSMPLVSQSAAAAAKRIVAGIESGQREITLTLTAKVAEALQGLLPGVLGAMLRLANLLLPQSNDSSGKKGYDSESKVTRGNIGKIADRAALRYNQH